MEIADHAQNGGNEACLTTKDTREQIYLDTSANIIATEGRPILEHRLKLVCTLLRLPTKPDQKAQHPHRSKALLFARARQHKEG